MSVIDSLELHESVQRMSRDTAKAAKDLTDQEARFIVDLYYLMQKNRMRTAHQARAASTSMEPNSTLGWISDQFSILEAQLQRSLDKYTKSHPMGKWMRGIYGIGPVLSAGLLAHIKIDEAPTAGHIWRYAGLDSTVKWIGQEGARKVVKEAQERIKTGDLKEFLLEDLQLRLEHSQKIAQVSGTTALLPFTNIHVEAERILARSTTNELHQTLMVALCCRAVNRRPARYYTSLKRAEAKDSVASLTSWLAKRPWNAQLKVLCWKVGESFVKFSGSDKCTYGQLYKQRKAQETLYNEMGKFADQAKEGLAKYGKDTDAYAWCQKGLLPPAHIHARSTRWAVKIFISHLHGEWFRTNFGKEPPMPYAHAHLGHTHMILPPALVEEQAE